MSISTHDEGDDPRRRMLARLTAFPLSAGQGFPDGVRPSLLRRVVMLCMAIAEMADCATMPKEQPREPSFALDDPSCARLGRLVAPQLREHRTMSVLIQAGAKALDMRSIWSTSIRISFDWRNYFLDDVRLSRPCDCMDGRFADLDEPVDRYPAGRYRILNIKGSCG
jgi:hypothetical protein